MTTINIIAFAIERRMFFAKSYCFQFLYRLCFKKCMYMHISDSRRKGTHDPRFFNQGVDRVLCAWVTRRHTGAHHAPYVSTTYLCRRTNAQINSIKGTSDSARRRCAHQPKVTKTTTIVYAWVIFANRYKTRNFQPYALNLSLTKTG